MKANVRLEIDAPKTVSELKEALNLVLQKFEVSNADVNLNSKTINFSFTVDLEFRPKPESEFDSESAQEHKSKQEQVEEQEQEKQQEPENNFTPLTKSIGYKVVDGKVILGKEKEKGKMKQWASIPLETMETIYTVMPEEVDSKKLEEIAENYITINDSYQATALLQILDQLDMFGGRLEKVNKKYVFIKQEESIYEQNKKNLKVEQELTKDASVK